ncbi:MAG: tRNA uridine-5-carboxymethylaminomethyl(34) synthesis GTPase MnmE [Candidatus Choladocola sp.]|nr:tRNA uridine-5-carboxymethylaminomethyl(34) synthesis GTPase MnmE [Candidatus Choladocola sp.]
MKNDTIAAISTAMAGSGIGIIRISGSEAVSVADRVYHSKDNRKKLADQPSHTIHYGFIQDGDEVIDEVLVMIMRSPKSFTAEDTVEINCHGGVYAMKRVLDTVIRNGARPAEPGEFTKRAFLNGRIDLSQAEAVIDVIQSKNEYALKSSVSQLKGSVQKKVKELRERILYQTAFIESALDDPEHISLEGYPRSLKSETDLLMAELKKLIDSADNGRIMKEGIQTVIVGKPNAGKSSLLNTLLGEERAIVTDIAGTTRDVLEETITLNGITLNIVDTAGIRSTEDVVEKIGVGKAREKAEEADLIIYVVDSSTETDENDMDIIHFLEGKKAVILLNKTDLETVTTEEMIRRITGDAYPVISVSAKENTGIDFLEEKIREMFYHGDISFNDEIYITNARQKSSLQNCFESLQKVQESIETGLPEDFYSIDLMSAYESLGEITGEAVGEDLVNEIFGRFCMGK